MSSRLCLLSLEVGIWCRDYEFWEKVDFLLLKGCKFSDFGFKLTFCC